MSDGITETGIAVITVALSDVFNRLDKPIEGTAKWFKDELDQIWVKYNIWSNSVGSPVEHHVIPASRVREVLYLK